MPEILKSWKTTAAGIAELGLVGALLMGRITADQFMAATGVVLAGGFLAAGDAGK